MNRDDEAKNGQKQQDAAEENKTEKKTPAVKLEDIRSLNDYYQTQKLPAARFLAALKKNKISKIQKEDMQSCLDAIDERDPEFARTLDLLFRAVSAQQSPLTRQCIAFASHACQQQLNNHYQIRMDLNKSAKDLFTEALIGLKPGLMAKKVDNRSINLLKAIAIWKSHSRNLDKVETIELLVKELLPDNAKSNGRLPDVFEVLLKPATKFKAMLDMLRVARSVLIKAEHAREAQRWERQQRDKEFGRAQNYLEQLREVKAELDRNKEAIADLSGRLEVSKEEIASLMKRIEQQKAISVHGEGELRGRARVFLEKKLSPLLETAYEFAELDPPRKTIIVERLEMAKQEIGREIEWLRSSD